MADHMGTKVDQVWDDGAFRSVDTSISALIRQLALALTGLTVAYLGARTFNERLIQLMNEKREERARRVARWE